MKMKDLFEGGDWEKSVAADLRAKFAKMKPAQKTAPRPAPKDSHPDKSTIWKKGFADGKAGRMDPKASDAYGPRTSEYEDGYKAGISAQKKESVELDEGGFFDPDQPNPGDIVKHRNGAVGKVKKIETQDNETWVYFKGKDGDMYFGQWKKYVFPMNKEESVEENVSGAVAGIAMPMGDMQTRNGPKKKRRSKKK